jgi:hypothetical protein
LLLLLLLWKSNSSSHIVLLIWTTQMHWHWIDFECRDEGLTPEIPSNCPQKLVELMQMCWKQQPQQRPVSSLSLFLFLFFHFTHNSILLIFFYSSFTNVDRTLKQFVQCWNIRTWMNNWYYERSCIYQLEIDWKNISFLFNFWMYFNFDCYVWEIDESVGKIKCLFC